MCLQAILNKKAIKMLPKVCAAIADADSFEANQMRCYAVNSCCNTQPALVNKTQGQLNEFDSKLIKAFKSKGWM